VFQVVTAFIEEIEPEPTRAVAAPE